MQLKHVIVEALISQLGLLKVFTIVPVVISLKSAQIVAGKH